MKRYIKNITAFSFAVLLASSCTDVISDVTDVTEDPENVNMVPVEFEVEMEEFVVEGELGSGLSRAQIGTYNGAKHNLWKTGDRVAVPYGSSTNSLTIKSGVDTPSGVFVGTAPDVSGVTLVYPDNSKFNTTTTKPGRTDATHATNVVFNNVQVPTAGNVDATCLVMMGTYSGNLGNKTTSTKIQMKNCCALVKVNIAYECDEVVINANSLETLACIGSVNFNSNNPVITPSTTDYDISTCLKGTIKANTDYYIAVMPQTLNSGWTICCHNKAEDKVYHYSCSEPVTWKRNHIYSYGNFTKENANGVGVVDLSLPSGIKLAAMNEGAMRIPDSGDFYAWGDVTTEKNRVFGIENYKWASSTNAVYTPNAISSGADCLTKYVLKKNAKDQGKNLFSDNKTILEKDDDLIQYKYHDEHYRMPNLAFANEVKQYCALEWTSLKRSNGTTVEGVFIHPNNSSNKNKVWISLTGFKSKKDQSATTNTAYYSGASCMFYLTTLDSNSSWVVKTFLANNGTSNIKPTFGEGWVFRWEGVPVRAVRVPNTEGVPMYKKNIGAGILKTVYWGAANVGAVNPAETGGYFAWGELYDKSGIYNTKTGFQWSNYKWGTSNAETRYNQTDGLKKLNTSDDVANFVMGGSWKMPTVQDFKDLIANCDAAYKEDGNTEYNGVSGWEFTSKDATYGGNKIFLPAASGYGYNNSAMALIPDVAGQQGNVHPVGYYWTSEITFYPNSSNTSMLSTDCPYYLWFSSEKSTYKPEVTSYINKNMSLIQRFMGLPVRAVMYK